MNKIQKKIKYIAIELGIYLVISIFMMLLSILNALTNFSEILSKKEDNYYSITLNLNNNNINVDIDIPYNILKIINVEEFKRNK